MNELSKSDIISRSKSAEDNSTGGVYFLLCEEEIVYIGSSKESILSRISAHKKDKIFFSYYIHKIPEEKRLEFEAEMIFQYQPKYNKMISSKSTKSIIYIGQIKGNPNPESIELALVGNRVYVRAVFTDLKAEYNIKFEEE